MEPSPILTFVTTLRHPSNAKDYGAVERMFVDTLRSVDGQTDRRCKVLVIANVPFDVPADIRIPVEVVIVNFPPPIAAAGDLEQMNQAIRLDRGTKHAVALAHITDGYVMWVDADDFISNRIVGYVAGAPKQAGWHIDNGYTYDVRSGLTMPLGAFNTVCGTSLIFHRDQFPAFNLTEASSQQQILDELGEDRVLLELGSHMHLRERLGLQPLPFPGAVYCVNNGENWSGVGSGQRLGRPITAAMASEFGVQRLPLLRQGKGIATRVGRSAARRARVAISHR